MRHLLRNRILQGFYNHGSFGFAHMRHTPSRQAVVLPATQSQAIQEASFIYIEPIAPQEESKDFVFPPPARRHAPHKRHFSDMQRKKCKTPVNSETRLPVQTSR
jgi:hypothetical protein